MRTTPRVTPLIRSTPRPTSAVPLATSAPSASAPVSPAPDSATAIVTPTAFPVSPVVVQPQIPPTPTSEQQWLAQQVNRSPFEPPRGYIARSGAPLLWFDPRTGESLEIGTLLGAFTADAAFELRGTSQAAIAVPYRINKDYGLTAISDALIARMSAAGYTERVEAYVLLSEAVAPQ